MGRYYNPDDFVIQYPGKYTGPAKEAMASYFSMIDTINNTEVTGEDILAGTVKEPKLGATLTFSEDFIRYCNEKYAPDYAPMLDPEVARSEGYKNIFAMIGLTACDDVFTLPTPPEARDTLLVSQIFHHIESLRPVYPGDTVYMVRDKTVITDLTPETGSLYRHLHQKNYGTVYNQKGEIVNKVCFSLMESLKVYKDDCLPKPRTAFTFPDMWEDPDWFSRPQHIYTDEDYARFRDVAKNEVLRGNAPFFWEDVAVGTRIPDGMFGPIYDGVCPTKPYGMGVGGGRKLRRELLDDACFEAMVTDPATGIRTTADPSYNVPEAPDGIRPFFIASGGDSLDTDSPEPAEEKGGEINTADIHKTANERSALINFMGRDIALGHIMDWLGYHAVIHSCDWSIMAPDVHTALGKPVPAVPFFKNHARLVPGMETTTIPIHGLTTDLALTKAQVIEKYVEGQRHMIRIVFWNTDIEDRIWITGDITAELPSKNM